MSVSIDRPSPRRRRAWTVLLWTLAIHLGVYSVVLGLFSTQQAAMIFPGSRSQGQPWARIDSPPPGTELVRLSTASGEEIAALFGPALAPDGSPRLDAPGRPTVIFFYGNGDCLANMLRLHADLRRLGVNVLVPDYVGYGMSSGSPSETGCYETADAAYSHLTSRPDVDPRRIVAAGWSLGGACAVDLASRQPVIGLATFSAFTSMADMVRRLFWFVPGIVGLLQHSFDNERKLAAIDVPVFIAHGVDDELVPFSMAARLGAAARGPVRHLELPGIGHATVFSVGGPTVLRPFGAFLDEL